MSAIRTLCIRDGLWSMDSRLQAPEKRGRNWVEILTQYAAWAKLLEISYRLFSED
jgi:hypothetical protein